MIESLRRSVITVALLLSLIAAGARAVPATGSAQSSSAAPSPASPYETRAVHDPNGTGKFYMGREIAQVMGAGGIPWLDRDEREKEEQPTTMVAALGLHSGEVVADLGAGSGRISFMMAPRVAPGGKVYAVDIQEEMLRTIRERAQTQKITNVEAVKSSETDPHLPANSLDLVLMVDVYHELSYPYETMVSVRNALKRGGRVVFVEYRKEDPSVPIKEVHKMSVDQLEKEMRAIGLVRVQTIETLPIQHIVFFEKRD
jgi:precorrin-6B methylase 2